MSLNSWRSSHRVQFDTRVANLPMAKAKSGRQSLLSHNPFINTLRLSCEVLLPVQSLGQT